MAISPVLAGFPVPGDTRLDRIYSNQDGVRIGDSSMPVPGQHTASFPMPEQFQGKQSSLFACKAPARHPV